jgi:hypothetical protein
MTFFTIPGTVLLARSGIRAPSRCRSVLLADLDMRGFAISVLMLSTVVVPGSFLLFFRGIYPSWHCGDCKTVSFGTFAPCGRLLAAGQARHRRVESQTLN